MKILYLANIRLPTEKAHGAQIMKMCEAFANIGNEVLLAVPRRHNFIKADPFDYYGIDRVFSVRRLFTLDLVRFGPIGFMFQSISFAIAAALLAYQHGDDLVYSRDPGIVWLCGLFGIKTVWEMHVASDSFLARRAAGQAHKIVVISGGLREFYLERGVPDQRIIVAHDGVDLREFKDESKDALRAQLSLPAERRIIAYVGKFKTMGQSKGVEGLIEAMGKVVQARPNTYLLIVGLNEDERPLVQMCVEHAGLLESDHQLLGHVPRAQVPAYLMAADVLVMNYPNQPHYARMMSPLKLFEYMGSRVPIVSSDLPSIREVLSEKEAYFFAPDSMGRMVQAIEAALSDPGAVTKAIAAQAKVAQYTWQMRARLIIESL